MFVAVEVIRPKLSSNFSSQKGRVTPRFLDVAEVECIEGAGVYVVLHTGGNERCTDPR